MKNGYLDFDEYIRQGEPQQKERAEAWRVAIGLQAVDGLKTSEYLHETARRNIEGEISIDEARELIKTYYITKTHHAPDDDEKQEADQVSANITKILSYSSLDFSTKGYIALHRRIFEGVFKHAGQMRNYDIAKKEWVLNGDTVNYLNWEDLRRALDYDIEQERNFIYKGISPDNLISHISRFISGIWQVHAFREGNTRTTAVFAILYLRDIGFDVANDMFAEHSWYFRNALVRANYRNARKGIDYSPIYLERFFRNLLFGEQWDLRNRYLHIYPTEEWSVQPNMSIPEQVPHNYPTTTPQLPNKFNAYNSNIIKLVSIIGKQELSVKEIMTSIGLKDRKNISVLYLNPAIQEGYVRRLYPNSLHHPKQKYLLSVKGLTLYNELIKNNNN
ncbi:MAG: cell filamentation protein Fic [Lentimicrobiaceae bacterium]|nr:cell filamentation protein Fic [Lentimicrobiaceae bacterium]